MPNLNPIQPFWSSETGSDYNEYTATSATHYYITAYSLIALALSANASHINDIKLTDAEIYILITFSEEPDKDGWKNGYLDHFYDPATGKNYLNSTKNTAKSSFLNHYNKAVTELRKGNRITAIQELGRSLHFVQDVCEPHHCNNQIATQKKHSQFETWVGNNFENINSKANITEAIYTRTRNSTLEKTFDYAARSSHNQLNNASNTATFRQAAEVSIGNAGTYTIMVLYYFIYTNGLC